MRSGLLRHTVSIQSETPTPDGMGGSTLVWADVSGMTKVKAAIWPLKSSEALDAMKLELTVTHKIRIRYRASVTAKNRIKFGSRYFNIASIMNVAERNKQIDIMATEDV